jgi:DNA polymerase
MNDRGVQIDIATVDAAIDLLDSSLEAYDAELAQLTGGAATKASQVKKLLDWLETRDVHANSLDKENLEYLLSITKDDPIAHRALKIRELAGSAGVKKIYAMRRETVNGRAYDLFNYHGARTGRDTAGSIQPQNLVKAGPDVRQCHGCGTWHGTHINICPRCERLSIAPAHSWNADAVEDAVAAIRGGLAKEWFGDPILTISGVIRGLFTSALGKEFICSDYSSIEAVVTAVLSGEQWRIEAFQKGEDIYLKSASAITGTPYSQYTKKHPDRQKIGKPAELGLGFGGWIRAWRQFDKSDTYSDAEVKKLIVAWRDASPAIVEMWGGQKRGKPWEPGPKELFGLEGMAVAAIESPGQVFTFRYISFQMRDDVLYMRLPSGRELTYHEPRLTAHDNRNTSDWKITYHTWNSNPAMGPMGWVRMDTYGGRLMENAVQAVARDIMAHAVVNLEKAGYPIVLRVHDELVAEVPEGFGSIEEFERIMAMLPSWATNWPIRAAGGWRGLRYRKD